MFAFLLSTALLAAGTSPASGAPANVGYSDATIELLEKVDNGMLLPVRARRPVTIGFEASSNGLGGLGLNAGYNLTPHWSLEAGGGLGVPGARVGVRGRYNFLTSNWTPFLGFGVSYLFALDSTFGSYTDPWAKIPGSNVDFGSDAERKASYRVQSAPSASGMVGMSYQGRRGFSALVGLGWSQLLDRKSNVVVIDGTMSADKRRGLDLVNGSGPVASLMLGYSF